MLLYLFWSPMIRFGMWLLVYDVVSWIYYLYFINLSIFDSYFITTDSHLPTSVSFHKQLLIHASKTISSSYLGSLNDASYNGHQVLHNIWNFKRFSHLEHNLRECVCLFFFFHPPLPVQTLNTVKVFTYE